MTSSSREINNGESKILQVINEYGMEDIEPELVERWTRSKDRYSLRELSEFFNERVLESAMMAAGMNPIEGEVENYYRILTDDEVSSGVKMEAKNRLERHSVDVEAVQGHFVSYQTINRYLKNERGVERVRDDQEDEDVLEKGQQRLFSLQTRLVAVTEKTLDQLRSRGALTLGEFDVLVEVTITCTDCKTVYSLGDLFLSGQCNCTEGSDD